MFKNILTVVAFILSIFTGSHGDCLLNYLRSDTSHVLCLQANHSCSINAKGVSEFEISEILDIHNEFRSKVATGQEVLGGGLPKASNMMQLTWDKELQDIAQKWAEQCNVDNDCNGCRNLQKFTVGQNVFATWYGCEGDCILQEPNWKAAIEKWYNEVGDYEKKFLRSFEERSDGKKVRHFSQVVWAETQKIGCGYATYKDEELGHQFYVCNYGPVGNKLGAPVYKEGIPCSNCPKNSCCGSTCKGKKSYPGLCLSDSKSNSLPIHQPQKKSTLFSCAFQNSNPHCLFNFEGCGKWTFVENSDGNFLSVNVNPQETAMIHFRQPGNSNNSSCMVIGMTKVSQRAEKKNYEDYFFLSLNLEYQRKDHRERDSTQYFITELGYFTRSFPIREDGYLKISLVIRAPKGAPTQVIQIQTIDIFEENC